MKASELQGTHFFKGLIYGQAGVGKTVLAANFPGPIEYWDFDHKISSAVNHFKRTGQEKKLDDIDVYQFAALPPRQRIPEWKKRSMLIDQCTLNKTPLHFKTLVLDTLSSFSRLLMEDYLFSQSAIKRPNNTFAMSDYGLFATDITRVLTGLLALDCNIVVLAHEEADKDEVTGVIVRQPAVVGKKIAPLIPSWFEEVYVARVTSDGKRILQTQAGGNYVARCQRGLEKEIPMQVGETEAVKKVRLIQPLFKEDVYIPELIKNKMHLSILIYAYDVIWTQRYLPSDITERDRLQNAENVLEMLGNLIENDSGDAFFDSSPKQLQFKLEL